MILNNKVLREGYLKRLRGGKDVTHTAKIITGVRRCGKSTLMRQYMAELAGSGIGTDRIFYFNMESEEYKDVRDSETLGRIIKETVAKDRRTYIFFDELQRVDGWERNINSLMADYDADIYITGSNAYLLSSELATYMSGRYVEIRMLPLSFREYLELHPADEKKNLDMRFSEYMIYGAVPIIDPDAEDKEFLWGQIEGAYNTVLIKDVLARMTPRDTTDLEAVSKYLYSNIGNLTNSLNISRSSGITPMTAKTYVRALEDAFLFYKVYRYDTRGKRILKSSEKYYASDVGMRNAALNCGASDTGRLLENIVFLELIRRGYKVTVGSFRDTEIDFTAQKPGRTEYFQVTESLIFNKNAEREVRSLETVNDNFPKTILSLDRLPKDPGSGIMHLNVIDWLLGGE